MKKVLIIEDDPIVAHIYRTRLEKESYAVETCSDGQTGFYRIHEFQPDGVLLDLMLPKMNGIDILKKIRAQGHFAQVPIVVFTNAYVPNMIQEAFSAGASQVFNKATLTPRQILDALHLLLNGSDPAGSILQLPEALKPSTGNTTQLPGQPRLDPLAQLAEPTSSYGSPPPPHHYRSSLDLSSLAPPAGKIPASSVPQLNSDDSAFHAELHQAFVNAKSDTLAALRKLPQDFTKASDENTRAPHLHELYRKVHALTGSAGIAGFSAISQMTAALEVLLKELTEKPKNINASTLRTVAHSIDFIGELFKVEQPGADDPPPAHILVVDDEILSRRAITYALEKASLKSVSVEDPNVALKMATEHGYDLIFLDVQMPGMDGFELCKSIRAQPNNKLTPIIFVTSLTDFKSRAKSSLSGGTDLIAKPFMFIELTVKALTHVLRNRLLQRKLAA
jgi:DNA-binding response OmpR family regulator/HPt (histidine-containing phosphotransfer) domain-containing protein